MESIKSIDITKSASTFTELIGSQSPEKADSFTEEVINTANDIFNGKKADRVFVFNPDAIALHIYEKYHDMFGKVLAAAPLELTVKTVMPSVTPVCFASMYTGAVPQVHGIQSYTKPVLTTDTVFDALLRSGKKVAIVSTEGDSISKIFLERNMDYYIYEEDEECTAKALELIEKDEYDFITLYNGNYDSTMHRNAPEGEASIEALKDNTDIFGTITDKIKECWKQHNTAVVFAPDHGCHEIDGGMGSHGLDMYEDLYIKHFYGFYPASCK